MCSQPSMSIRGLCPGTRRNYARSVRAFLQAVSTTVQWGSRDPVVPNRSSMSCNLGVFVDQSAEPVAASEVEVGR
ncbi:MAG TPA: hypothetical protein VF788_03060, partial [Pseudonocardiaceae bacterium]